VEEVETARNKESSQTTQDPGDRDRKLALPFLCIELLMEVLTSSSDKLWPVFLGMQEFVSLTLKEVCFLPLYTHGRVLREQGRFPRSETRRRTQEWCGMVIPMPLKSRMDGESARRKQRVAGSMRDSTNDCVSAGQREIVGRTQLLLFLPEAVQAKLPLLNAANSFS
jgi:hypothetical protein